MANWKKNSFTLSEKCHPLVRQFFDIVAAGPLTLNWLTDNTPLTTSFYYGLRDGNTPQVNNLETALNALDHGFVIRGRVGGVVKPKKRVHCIKVPPSRLRGVHWTSKRLFTILWEKRFPVSELAQRSGVPADTIYGWKSEFSCPMLPALVKVLDALGYDLLIVPQKKPPRSEVVSKAVRHKKRPVARWPNIFEMRRGYPIDVVRAAPDIVKLFFSLVKEQLREKEWLVEKSGYSHIVLDKLREGDDCQLLTLDTLFESIGYRLGLEWPEEPVRLATKKRGYTEPTAAISPATHRLCNELREYITANEYFYLDVSRASGINDRTIGLLLSGKQAAKLSTFTRLIHSIGIEFKVNTLH